MKHIIATIVTSAFLIPLSFAQSTAFCPRDANNVLQPYSVQGTNAQGQTVTMTFDPTAQAGFCRVLSYWGA